MDWAALLTQPTLTKSDELWGFLHINTGLFTTTRVVRFGSYWFPDTVEISLLPKDLAPDAVPASRIQTALDRTCDPRVTEVDLSGILTIPTAN